MIKSLRRAAVVLSGIALALTAAMLPAQAATTGWRVNTEFHSRGNTSVLFSVDAVSARDAWTTGIVASDKNGNFQSVVRHWTGKRWQLITLPAKVAKRWQNSSPIDAQIAASSARNVWVINGFAGGRYLHLSGTRWTIGSLPGGGTAGGFGLQITAVKDLGPDNIWAFGAKTDAGLRTLRRALQWQQVDEPGVAGQGRDHRGERGLVAKHVGGSRPRPILCGTQAARAALDA
jgi:hypothetical protein